MHVGTGALPGGQYWRHPDPALGADERAGHHDWRTFAAPCGELQAHLDAGCIRNFARAEVALLNPGPPFQLHLTPVTGDARRILRPDLGDHPDSPLAQLRPAVASSTSHDAVFLSQDGASRNSGWFQPVTRGKSWKYGKSWK